MKKPQNNYAYIDAANLHNATEGLGWKLDYKKFRVLLSEKYGVENAYIFIGLIDKYQIYMFICRRVDLSLSLKKLSMIATRNQKGTVMLILFCRLPETRMKINFRELLSCRAMAITLVS